MMRQNANPTRFPRAALGAPLIAALTLLLPAPPAEAGGRRSEPREIQPEELELQEVESRKVGAKQRLEQHLLADEGATGWIVMIDSLEFKDLDLYVFEEEPDLKRGRGRLVCSSESLGPREICRVAVPRAWVVVEYLEGGGSTNYTLWARALRGQRLGETDQFTGEAREVDLEPESPAEPGEETLAWSFSEEGAFELLSPINATRFQHLYRIPLPSSGQPFFVNVLSWDEAELEVDIFDAQGEPLASGSGRNVALDIGSREALSDDAYLLVSLSDRRAISSTPGYRVQGWALDEGEIRIGAGGIFETTGSGDETFTLRLEVGELAVVSVRSVSLAGRSPASLEVRSDGGAQVVRASLAGQQYAWVGQPVGEPFYVLEGVGKPTRVQIEVAGPSSAEPDDKKYGKRDKREKLLSDALQKTWFGRWRLKVLTNRREFSPTPLLPYLVPLAATDIQTWSSPIGTKTFTSGADGTVVVVLTRNPRAPSLRASLRALDYDFDLAICDRYGQVLDIGDDWISWSWPSDGSSLYLVLFPSPGLPGAEGKMVEVEVLEDRSAGAFR